jgi:hypothetical protein
MSAQPKFKFRGMSAAQGVHTVEFEVRNQTDAPIHLVVRPRGVSVDASGAVHLRFWDEPLPEGVMAGLFARPPTRILESGEDAIVQIKFPSQFREVTGQTLPDGRPEIRIIDVATAPDLVLDLAWANVPFYEDTRKEERPRPQVLFEQSARWAAGRHSLKIPRH